MIARIVQYVNDSLQAQNLAADRFAKASFNGIAITQLRKAGDQFDAIPMLFEDGKPREITPNDEYVITVWHKNLGSPAAVMNKQQYGDKDDLVTRVMQMTMLVIVHLGRAKMSAEEIDLQIVDALPTKLEKALEQELKIHTSVIKHQGSNFNSAELYLREFRTSEYRLKPHHQMIEVKYSIECTFRKGCINTCNEC